MIVVAGECLVDLVIDASGAIAPRAGGSAYNTARAIARLGGECAFLGRFATDRFGKLLRTGLVADGVQLVCPEQIDAPTTLALADLDERGNAAYHFYLAATAAALVSEADAMLALEILGASRGSRAVCIGSLGLFMAPIGSSIEVMVQTLPPDVLLLVDPNCRPAAIADPDAYRRRLGRLWSRADVVKASDEDLAFLVPGSTPVDAARTILDLGPTAALVTRGSAPALAITTSSLVEVPVPEVRVVDTIGAGDTIGGAFLAWWTGQGLGRGQASDLDALERGLRVATAAAAVTCQRAGADPPSLPDLDEATRRAWVGATNDRTGPARSSSGSSAPS